MTNWNSQSGEHENYLNNSSQRHLLSKGPQKTFLAKIKEQYLESNFRSYLDKLHQANPNFSVLEIGPGSGSFAQWLKSEFSQCKYTAIDIDASVVQHLSQSGFSVIKTDNLPNELNQNQKVYDCIVLLDVLEHIPLEQAQKVLRLIPQKMAFGGFTFIQVPNLAAPFSGNIYYGDITHCLPLNEISLEQLLLSVQIKNYQIKPYLLPKGFIRFLQGQVRNFFYLFLQFLFFLTGTIRCKILTPNLVAIIQQ